MNDIKAKTDTHIQAIQSWSLKAHSLEELSRRGIQPDNDLLDAAVELGKQMADVNTAVLAEQEPCFTIASQSLADLAQTLHAASAQAHKPDLDLSQWRESEKKIRVNLNEAIVRSFPFIGYSAKQKSKITDLHEDASRIVAKMRSESSSLIKDIKKHTEDAEEASERVSAKLEEVTVAKYSDHFRSIATTQLRWSFAWVSIIIASMAIVGLAALRPSFIGLTPTQDTQDIISRLAIISLGYATGLWAARNHRAMLHLASVNRHRHIALQTFEVFVNNCRRRRF